MIIPDINCIILYPTQWWMEFTGRWTNRLSV